MMLLVDDSLKFQMAILQIHCYLLLKKYENPFHILSTKNNSVFAFKVDIQGVPKKRSRYKKVHSFLNNTDLSKIFYTVVMLL